MSVLNDLRKTPIEIDAWMLRQVGFDNDGPYKDEYPRIKVLDSLEPLVNVSEFGIVSSDFYLTEYLSGKEYLKEAVDKGLLRSFSYLRESHVVRLQKVDNFLRENGFFLHIQSGWRHPELQEIVIRQYAKEYGELKARRLFAPVKKESAPPPHATGAAFDLEIRSLADANRQELYWSLGDKDIYSASELECLAKSSPDLLRNPKLRKVLENRRVLFHCLCSKGVVFDDGKDLFTPHPGECWHFGDGDPLSAYLRKENHARYGFTHPN